MSDFDDAFDAQSDAIYDTFGDAATYQDVRNGRFTGAARPFTVSAGVAPQIRTSGQYGNQIGTYSDMQVPMTIAPTPKQGDQIIIAAGMRAGTYVVEVIKSFAGKHWILDAKNIAITRQGANGVNEKRN